ncbi:MAG: hypothetical protein H6729_06400 [Deltaproteobacteria bacterium]|nr:hypothetical protein [Deltaproteobacteria bacterium]
MIGAVRLTGVKLAAVIALTLALPLSSCGDPLVSSAYRGEPILRLFGKIESVGHGWVGVEDGEEALVSMFWNTDLSTTAAPPLVAQDSVSAALQFPSTFEIRVFDPPTSAHLVASDGRFGVGLLLVYIDANANHAFDRTERVIGGSLSKALVWATTTIPATESPFSVELPEGFSVIQQPFSRCVVLSSRNGEGGPGSLDGGSHVRSCAADSACPSELVCDATFHICVPQEDFELTIDPAFSLDDITCDDSR